MAALEMRLAIKIKASPQKVFDLLTDINRIPELFAGFKSVQGFHGGKVKNGDKWTVLTEFMGRDIKNEYTVTKLSEPKTLAWRSVSSQAITDSAFEIQETEEGSRLVLEVEGNPANIFASVGLSLVEENLKQGIIDDLKNIRSILES